MKPKYQSSIPSSSTERIKERYPNGSKKVCHYYKNQKKVGVRFFSEDGLMELEYGVKNRKMHGGFFEWIGGKLIFIEFYKNGRSHGIAKQWSSVNGKLIGSFEMKKGNGIDLWWHDWPGRCHLSELCYLKNGRPHGLEWWLNHNEKSVLSERHWHNGKWHGIHRLWEFSGRLTKGYPKYYIRNRQVSKTEYVNACQRDSTLPRYRKEDDRWKRVFPTEIKRHLRRN
ncbi:hypothetical protein L0222_13880 [bacterium]|nr:hypothetical protein [bacterium]